MSTLREAAEKALKALGVATTPFPTDQQEVRSAMDALRAELAKPDAPAAAPGGWQGLTEQERTKAVSAIEGYGTDFVAPIYAVIEGIERTLFERNTPRPAPAEPQPIAAWSIVRTAESAVVTAVRAALSAAPAPQPAGGERERYEFVLAQCREAQDIAASRGWALNDIATASTTDPKARKIATEALLGAPQVQRAGLTDERIDAIPFEFSLTLGDDADLSEPLRKFARAVEAELRKLWGISPAGADTKGEQT